MNLDDMRHVPKISNAIAKEKEQRNIVKHEILNNSVAANKLHELAKALDENFNTSTQILANIRVGATIEDKLTKQSYVYEYLTVPLKHHVHAEVIFDLAKKPLEEFTSQHYAVLYDANINPSPRYLVSLLDLCKYVATGVWVVSDMNNQAETDFYDKIKS